MVQLIRRGFEDAETTLLNILDEEEHLLLLDLLEQQEDLVNGSEFVTNTFDKRLNDLGIMIEKNVDDYSSCRWVFNDVVIPVDFQKLKEYSNHLFDNLILPYLQLEYSDEIRVSGDYESLVHFFTYHLIRNNYIIVDNKTLISKIALVTENSWAVEWTNNDCFEVKSDLNSVIPICIRITPKLGRIVEKKIEISFPFYKRNDTVSVSICNIESKWILSAINENNGLEYISEIII